MADAPADTSAQPDASINHAAALEYWSSNPPTVNSMLGGHPQLSRIDLQSSANFLAKLRRSSRTHSPGKPLARAVDCGAGIGRVTLGFLAKVAEVVDLVEPVEKFTRELVAGQGRGLKAVGKIGEVFNLGLEEWMPADNTYDLIWNQWCLGHLTDVQLVEYFCRCKGALVRGGWIVVKENMSTDLEGRDVFDEVDNSVTRTDGKFRTLFKQCGLKIVATEVQRGFPKELYPVRVYALQPDG